MGLGDQIASIAKRRAIAHVRHDGQAAIVPARRVPERPKVAEIDARRGQDLGFRCEVRGRKSDGAAAPIPFDDPSPGAEWPAEQQPSLLDVAVGQEFANPGRVDISALDLNLGHDRDGETEVGTTLGQHAHRALPIASKMKVITDIDLEWPHAFMNMMANEMLWADPRERTVEGFSDHRI
jgi:hypothetical protein